MSPTPAVMSPTNFNGIVLSTENVRQQAVIAVIGIALIPLLVGDVVQMDVTGKVTKLTAPLTGTFGVVVGGQLLHPNPTGCIVTDQGMVNKPAANANQVVTICIAGIAYCIADAAILLNELVIPSALVAGRVHAAGGAPAVGTVIGKALRAAGAAANVVEVLIAHS